MLAGTTMFGCGLLSSPAVRQFFGQAIPGVVAGGIPQLKLMAGAMVASSSQAAVSWLYYANRLYELPLGVISIAISAVLVPAIAAGLRGGGDRVADAQSRALEIALGLKDKELKPWDGEIQVSEGRVLDLTLTRGGPRATVESTRST